MFDFERPRSQAAPPPTPEQVVPETVTAADLVDIQTSPDAAAAAQEAGVGNAAVAAEIEAAAVEEGESPSAPTHTIQSGESLWAISMQYGVSIEAIAAANGLDNPNQIAVGQVLVIPGAGQTAAQQGGEQGGEQTRIVEPVAPVNADAEQLNAVSQTVLDVVPASQSEHAATNVPAILAQCAALGVTDPNQVAYILATAEHESRFGTPQYSRSESLVEDRNPARQDEDGNWTGRNHLTGETITAATYEEFEKLYWDNCYGGMLGNEAGTSDAADFRGRGFVQLTGRSNYENMTTILTGQGFSYTVDGVTYGGEGGQAIDLVAHPEHVNQVPELAARVLVTGMMDGEFTTRALPEYVNADGVDFENARRVVNGDVKKNGAAIAELAANYQAALTQWSSVFKESGS